MYAFADIEFPREKVLRLTEQQVGDQARSQDFQKGGYMNVCMPVCMDNFISIQDWWSGGMHPHEILML